MNIDNAQQHKVQFKGDPVVDSNGYPELRKDKVLQEDIRNNGPEKKTGQQLTIKGSFARAARQAEIDKFRDMFAEVTNKLNSELSRCRAIASSFPVRKTER